MALATSAAVSKTAAKLTPPPESTKQQQQRMHVKAKEKAK
jgi:hypothetical protein